MATGVESTFTACAQAGELGKKRPRSLSPTDSKICEVANSILSKEEALPLIQNMYSKATWRSPKVISLAHLAERRFLLRKSDNESPVMLQGYFSNEMIAQGGESQLYPVVSKEGQGYFFSTSRHSQPYSPIPEISRTVGKNAFSCAYVPESVQTDVQSQADYRFQLVEHAKEGDLRNFLRRKNLHERENSALPDLGLQLLEKVKVLHDHGGAHRDIKPANLLVDTKEGRFELFIGDFGMYTTDKARCGQCGTRGYRGPEASEFFKFFDREFKNLNDYIPENYDPKLLDLYAIGVTLFEILTKGSLATAITKWFDQTKTITEEARCYSKKDFQKFRQMKIESFLAECIYKASESSWIKVPEFAEVIQGLIQEEPEKRMALVQAIALWKKGLQRIANPL
jgi:hypothetical protein